jgi:hypothetical protein
MKNCETESRLRRGDHDEEPADEKDEYVDEFERQQQQYRKRRKNQKEKCAFVVQLFLVIAGGMTLIGFLLALLSIAPPPPRSHNDHPQHPCHQLCNIPAASSTPIVLNCGPTASTALSLDCIFDLLSFTWLPAPCYDAELTGEFLAAQPWRWFADANGTEEVSLAEASRGTRDLYVTRGYHQAHCAFAWRKLHRAVLNDESGWDGYVGKYEHTVHCAGVLMRGEEKGGGEKENEVNTVIRVKFPNCTR